jgi:O-antigen/teichoic acid export membrane protein
VSAFPLLARRAGAHSGLYVASGAATLLLGLVSVAVLTRFLAPAEFGKLAILLVANSILSMVFNLVTLQGTLSWAYGTVAGDDDDPGAGDMSTARDPRRALGTGLVITALAGAAGSAAVAAAAPALADWLLGSRSDASLVIWIAVAAAGSSMWRLVTNAVRVERRPAAYLGGSVALHVLQLAGMTSLLAIEPGVEEAVIGLALGTLAGLVVAVALCRRSLRFAFSVADARAIWRRGKALVPVVVSTNVIQLGDVIVLSRFAATSDVGLYRVASRIGASVSYWTSAFHMGWGPLRKDPLHIAAERELSSSGVAVRMASYFVLSTAWVLLGLTVLADELVRIAAPSYGDASPLIPLTAAGFALHGLFVLVYRTQQFRTKRKWFIWLAVLAAASFVGLSLILVPSFEAYGVSIAAIGAWGIAIAGMGLRGARSQESISYDYGRIAKSIVVASGLAAAALLLDDAAGPVEPLVDLAAVALYPLLLVRLGALSRAELRLRRGADARASAESDDEVLRRLVVEDQSPAEVATRMGLDEAEVRRRLVTMLRRTTGSSQPSPLDERIGAWLLGGDGFAQWEREAQELLRAGADPLELDRLSSALRRERRARRRRNVRSGGGRSGGV